MTESEDFEEKSAFDFKYGQEFSIVRTIVAFANTEGGKLRLSSFQCQASRLDSARLDDLINRFVVPRVGGISSSVLLDGSCEIIVRKSKQAPHVFSAYQSYVDERGRDRSAWQVGQVPVRHSSKTKEASADDFQRLIAERVQDVLAAIANSISRFGTKIGQEDNAIPVRLTTEIEALEIGMHDPNLIYPYNATQVARRIKKKINWVAKAVRSMGLLNDPTYHFALGGYKSPIHRYSEACVEVLRAKLKDEPAYSPWASD